MKKQLYILANSPGELSGWVAPVVEEFRSIAPDVTMTVALIPDWFTSGREQEFAARLPVDRVVKIFVLLRELWADRVNQRQNHNLVLFLGGDALYAKGLARLLQCPAMAYMPRVYSPRSFHTIFVPGEAEKNRALRKGAEPEQIQVVPTLALDSVRLAKPLTEIRQELGLATDAQPIFALLTGSRPEYAELGFQLMLDVAELLLARYPSGLALLPVSPFNDRAVVLDVLRKRNMKSLVHDETGAIWTGPEQRIGFVTGKSHDVLAISDVAVTIPGTNNLQCAALGVPFVVILPLNWVEHIPFEGLLGLLYPRLFPFNHLKKWLVAWMNARIPFLSMVNRTAGRMLVQEMRAILTPEEIAAAAAQLWEDRPRREQLKSDLLELTRERGAARKIAEAMREYFLSDQRLR